MVSTVALFPFGPLLHSQPEHALAILARRIYSSYDNKDSESARAYRELGKKGPKARAKALTPKRRKEIASKASRPDGRRPGRRGSDDR